MFKGVEIMEIKTTEQIRIPHKEAFDTKWVKVDDEKERLSHTIEFIKQYCIKMHKTNETDHCDCDRYILTILRHINELSQSNPLTSVRNSTELSSGGNDTFKNLNFKPMNKKDLKEIEKLI